jgi:hypothetical protein
MATATPFDLTTPARERPSLSALSAEEAAYLGSFAALCDEEDERHPGLLDREIEASQMYGSDLARELQDIDAGRHPLQR